jgi:hypothetical protein
VYPSAKPSKFSMDKDLNLRRLIPFKTDINIVGHNFKNQSQQTDLVGLCVSFLPLANARGKTSWHKGLPVVKTIYTYGVHELFLNWGNHIVLIHAKRALLVTVIYHGTKSPFIIFIFCLYCFCPKCVLLIQVWLYCFCPKSVLLIQVWLYIVFIL